MSSSSKDDSFLSLLIDDDERETYAGQTIVALLSRRCIPHAETRHFCGRQPGTENIERGPCRWYDDYLSYDPVYPSTTFPKNFRIPISLYWKLHNASPIEEPSLLNARTLLLLMLTMDFQGIWRKCTACTSIRKTVQRPTRSIS